MKRMILTALFLTFAITAVAQASEVALGWIGTDPAPEGYRIYQRAAGESFNYSFPAWTGTGTQAEISGLEPEATYFFVVRAFTGDQESANSNEHEYTVPAEGTVPAPDGLTDDEKTQLGRIEEKIDLVIDAFSILDKILAQSAAISDEPATAAYCGNPDSKIFHKSSHWCGQGAVTFDDRQAAIDAGYEPCGVCKP